MKARSPLLSGIVLPALLAGMSALLLLWGFSDKYLWQDEAQTAVLAERLLRFGRPLAYDGVNLITIDQIVMEDAATVDQRTADPKAAIQYYIRRGDLKPDTTWRWQPWGQFIVEAASLKALGRTTFAARLPFALAGILTVVLLYWFVLNNFSSTLMAFLAALFLCFNSYWILHSRQARYYSLSSLLLVLTLMAYARWQRGGSWGAAAFVAAAWCWFQVDYGTLWPVLLVLFCDAFWAQRRNLWRPALVGSALAAAFLPWIYYFELWHRVSKPARSWGARFVLNLVNLNEYVVPVLILVAAFVILRVRRPALATAELRLVLIACATVAAFALWIPFATPAPYLRYLIIVAPVGCFLSAWVLVRACGSRSGLAWLGAAIIIITPWSTWLLPAPRWYKSGTVLRPELAIVLREVFGHRPDPNRLVIEWLKQNAAPTDEILVNYEDVPLMFYLPNPIRGGVAGFRVEDDAQGPPDFVVLRRSVKHVPWQVYNREIARYQWSEVPLQAPDVPYGNNPDPSAQGQDLTGASPIYVGRRIQTTMR